MFNTLSSYTSLFLEYLKSKILLKNTRRIIFVSSLLGVMRRMKDPDQETLIKLNKLLVYVKVRNSFILPMYIKEFIWKDIDGDNIVINSKEIEVTELLNGRTYNDQEVQTIGEFFYERTPNWLKYGSKDMMIQDIANVLKVA